MSPGAQKSQFAEAKLHDENMMKAVPGLDMSQYVRTSQMVLGSQPSGIRIRSNRASGVDGSLGRAARARSASRAPVLGDLWEVNSLAFGWNG